MRRPASQQQTTAPSQIHAPQALRDAMPMLRALGGCTSKRLHLIDLAVAAPVIALWLKRPSRVLYGEDMLPSKASGCELGYDPRELGLVVLAADGGGDLPIREPVRE
jgi:hypothetical protein